MTAELCHAALHLIAADAAGAGADEPIGIVGAFAFAGKVLAVEGVVAGAVGAEVAVCFIFEAIVLTVLFYGEYDAAVFGNCLAVYDLGRSRLDAEGIVLCCENAACVCTVDNDLIAVLEDLVGIGLLMRILDHEVELLSKESLVAAYRVVGTPVALIGIPLHIVVSCYIFNVEAAVGLGSGNIPCGVDIVKRHT